MWTIFLTGFSLGMISSFHCVGMCGPLALSLPTRNYSAAMQALAVGAYHLGRIATYALLGCCFGLLGRRIYVAGWQQVFSLLLGFSVLIILVGTRLNRHTRPALPGKLYRGLMQWISRLWQSPAKIKFLLLGMANGLLPCGMVYLAIALALNTSKVTYGMAFMASFGAGTLPLMIMLSLAARLLRPALRMYMRRLTPVLIAFAAFLLILRGLGLGIPFISPVLPAASGQVISCH